MEIPLQDGHRIARRFYQRQARRGLQASRRLPWATLAVGSLLASFLACGHHRDPSDRSQRQLETFAAPTTIDHPTCLHREARPRHPTLGNRLTSSSPTRRSAVAAAGAVTPFLTAHGGFHIPKAILLVLFIAVDCGQALVMDWAEKRSWQLKAEGGPVRQYARQTALVVESTLSLVTGVSLAFGLGGFSAVLECFNPQRLLQFFPVAVCFATGLSLKMMAVNHFQAGTIKIVGQMRLPMLALASTFLLARRYTTVQSQVIGIITTSCVSFVLLKGQSRNQEGKSWKWKGLAQLFGWILMNVAGGICAEMTYKSSDTPYYIQKVAQDFGHLFLSLIMLFLVVPIFDSKEDITNKEMRPGGFFDGWDHRTVAVVALLFLDAWIGNLLLKEFSGVARSVAKAFGVAAVYFASFFYSKDRRNNPALTSVALMVIQSSLLFSFVSQKPSVR
eukprot:TRINITY_DN90_c1_g1_i1.p1 TRINITY_DN90_c1_g1~~TRINITY_DN90_c1_g1_i1.p1  ORF type:complete len:446 (-),score=67.21 TRINITY_DN90_c1_g1_i1:97-1434(-)